MKGRTKVQKPVKEEPSRKKEAVPPKQEAPAEPAEPAPPKAEPGVVTSAKTEESAEPSTVVPPASEAREVPVPRFLISSESDDGYERPRGRSESETKSPKRAEPEIYHEALEEVVEEEDIDVAEKDEKLQKANSARDPKDHKESVMLAKEAISPMLPKVQKEKGESQKEKAKARRVVRRSRSRRKNAGMRRTLNAVHRLLRQPLHQRHLEWCCRAEEAPATGLKLTKMRRMTGMMLVEACGNRPKMVIGSSGPLPGGSHVKR